MSTNIYRNGNYITKIDDKTGTRTRIQYDDNEDFIPEFPESLDVNLTQKCNGGCQFCYAECIPDGKHGDIMSAKFVDTLHMYTEVALQVNDMSHPDLIPFLEKLKEKKVLPSITVNQMHFEQKEDFISELIDNEMIYGLGVSLKNPTQEFIQRAQKYPNLVVHTIIGINTPQNYIRLVNKGLKVLILGYKDKGRGHDFLEKERKVIEYNQKWLKESLNIIINCGWYPLISFDNLALEQLDVKSLLPTEQWERFFQGVDGHNSLYIDLVDRTFGKSSLVSKTEMMPLMDDIKDMFNIVRRM